jgi:hypothetical protein
MLLTDKETIKKSSGRFISFVKHAFSVVQSSRISQYSCKYSRRDYTQHQLLTLILFKEYRKEDYRTVIWNLEEMDRIHAVLGLTTIPHFTTLQKFLCRMKSLYLDIFFKNTLKRSIRRMVQSPSLPSIHPGLPAAIPVIITSSEPVKSGNNS